MAIEVLIHDTGSGTCSLTGKEGEGLRVTFRDGTVTEAFLSHKAFMQLVRMKAGAPGKPKPVQSTVPVNGTE